MGILRTFLKAAFSRNEVTPLILVTLDALGTIYKFRQPVADQYLSVARQCGLKARINRAELDQSFRQAFKDWSSEYPNYGKDRLSDSEEWWQGVVKQAFGKVLNGQDKVPDPLGARLYHHFSSGAAYEPYKDVRPFLRSMAALKQSYSSAEGPLVLTGVITNSDPRVGTVLQNVGFNVGIQRDFEPAETMNLINWNEAIARPYDAPLKTPQTDLWQPQRDFDMLVTSYYSNAEKPAPMLWEDAMRFANVNNDSRSLQPIHQQIRETRSREARSPASKRTPGWTFREMLSYHGALLEAGLRYRLDEKQSLRIHIGDEYAKDYLGAKGSGWDALHLARDKSGRKGVPDDVQVVSSLDEAAMVVNLMANEFLKKAARQKSDGGS